MPETTSNRTLEELKFGHHVYNAMTDTFQSHLRGIEIPFAVDSITTAVSSNRTLEELKCGN